MYQSSPDRFSVKLISREYDGMNWDQDLEQGQLQARLQAITADIRSVASRYPGDSLALLALLRALEQVHREIRENLFQPSLPDNRQALYALLRDIEEEGGWPYIDRMKLRSLLEQLPQLNNHDPETRNNNSQKGLESDS